jgi:sporulation protein YlmC with PRC-barrel domain
MKQLLSGSALALLLVTGIASAPSMAADDKAATPAGDSKMTTALPTGAHAISDYYQQAVYDEKDNKIGDVSDLLVGSGGKIDSAMVGVGGFLGVGEKNVAIPFDSLKVVEKDGKRYLQLSTTKEALQSAPGYVYDRNANKWMPAPKQG